MVGLARLAPVLLLPLFYRFRPLDRPALVERLMALAARARTDVVGVFEWVLSGHTRKANAALAGLGRTRRILLSDTLLADYSDDEIEVVLAHELAHHVHHDIWRGMALQARGAAGGFFVARLALRAWPSALGLSRPLRPGGAAAADAGRRRLVVPHAAGRQRAVARAGARRRPLRARDHRNPEAFVSAMKRLSQQNLAEDDPSPLVRWLFYSHPPIRRADRGGPRVYADVRPACDAGAWRLACAC